MRYQAALHPFTLLELETIVWLFFEQLKNKIKIENEGIQQI